MERQRLEIGAGQVKSSGKYPYGVCKKGVGRNSILCSKCKKWIHRKCSNIKGRLKQDPHYICPVCIVVHRREKIVEDKFQIKADVMLDCVENLCYLGDEIGVRGGGPGSVQKQSKKYLDEFQ